MPSRKSRRSQATDSTAHSDESTAASDPRTSSRGGASKGGASSANDAQDAHPESVVSADQPLTAYASEIRTANSAARGTARRSGSPSRSRSRQPAQAKTAGKASGRSTKTPAPQTGTTAVATPTSDPDLEPLGTIGTDLPMEQRPEEVLRVAREAFAKTGSWVVFYRWMLSPGGVVDQLYPTRAMRQYFETTEAFAELLEMVTSIRSQDDSKAGAYEPERMITVRLPRSMHDAVIRDAEALDLSINKYCLTKLLQPTNKRFTPLEPGTRRGRRPGPQIVVSRIQTDTKP